MAKQMQLVIFLAIASLFLSSFLVVSAHGHRDRRVHKGTATFYTPPYLPSACDEYKDEGVMIAAASHSIWNNGKACGKKLKVKCIGGTNDGPHPCRGKSHVTVKIVDFCPAGCQGTIDLSQEAFAAIADPDAGKIKISFKQ
ncbi:EG45-like domain containing protein [Impatiens glandulifera]|uniref:EG45-like domain containing protein n=1 Tax=Impatiens glandulifera TaxID=253017 RepID=UPI001FB11B6D|nr:EG45-like domain containing protein [Impatiens glandulifera]